MSVWVLIEHAPKDGTVVDLWGAAQTEETSRSLMMVHEVYMRRWTDCAWSPRVKRTSGLLMNLPDGWYFRWFRKSYSDEDADSADGWIRIYPTHYSLPLPGPNT